LIQQLQEIHQRYGDLNVHLVDADTGHNQSIEKDHFVLEEGVVIDGQVVTGDVNLSPLVKDKERQEVLTLQGKFW
jgi:hypothetical protein